MTTQTTTTPVETRAPRSDAAEGSRELASLHHPDDLESPEEVDALVDSLTDQFTAAVNAERARQGKPPLR